MPTTKRSGRKNGKRDAKNIAKCLAYKTYSPVHVPGAEDNAAKEYIRMRDDTQDLLKKTKQRVNAFCLRHGKIYADGSKWTQRHNAWLEKLEFGNGLLQETFGEYLATLSQLAEKVARLDKRIAELSQSASYREAVGKLKCLIGVQAHTALALITETGDFSRFPTAKPYASYLGLVPGENSSGAQIRPAGITKQGNSHLRMLLVESAQCYGRGRVGAKSKALAKKQEGNTAKDIAYADRANERLRRKFYSIMLRKSRCIAATAVARELACFIWGMMAGNKANEAA